MKTATRRYYQDPGHGWIRVPLTELSKLGIADQISTCSYMKGDFAYLEEDSDAAKYCNAMESAGYKLKLVELVRKRAAKLRNYPAYSPDGVSEAPVVMQARAKKETKGEKAEGAKPSRKTRSKVQSSSGDAKPKTTRQKRVSKTQKTSTPTVEVAKSNDGEVPSYLETGKRFASPKLKKAKITEGTRVSILDENERRFGKVLTILSEQIVVLMEDTDCVKFFFQKGLNIEVAA